MTDNDTTIDHDDAPSTDVATVDDLTAPGIIAVALADVDIWDIDRATRGIRATLTGRVREAAAEQRTERESMIGPDTVPGEADVAPLVRRLDDAASVFDRIGTDFKEVAKACRQEIAEDAAATGKTRIAIPHGEYSIIAKPKVKTTTTWDDVGVAGVIADLIIHDGDTIDAVAKLLDRFTVACADVPDMTVDEARTSIDTAITDAYTAGLRTGAMAAVHKTKELSTKTEWKVTALDGLRKHLMRAERDAIAGILERARSVKNEPTDEWDVTRDTGARRMS